MPAHQRYPWQRFWCPRDGRYSADIDGFVEDPTETHGWLVRNVLPYEALHAAPCLILLGEPGIGKSSAFQDAVTFAKDNLLPDEELLSLDFRWDRDLDRKLFNDDKFRAWQAGKTRFCLFLDSLDEHPARDAAAQLLGELGPSPVERLRLRIACRTGELPRVLDHGLENLWPSARPGTTEVRHYELLPLRRKDVAAAASIERIVADKFIAEVVRRGVTAMAVRPMTLTMLFDEFKANQQLPTSRLEVYQRGCERLCDEPSDTRLDHGQHGRLHPDERLAIARRLAAVSMLGGKIEFDRGRDSDPLLDEQIRLRALEGNEVVRGRQVAVTEADIAEVLEKTGLFTGRGPRRAGWAHLSYAEFLAAEFLRARQLSDEDVRRLLASPTAGDLLPPALYGLAGWLIDVYPELFSWMLRTNVAALLRSDLEHLSDDQRAQIVDALLARADTGDLLDDFSLEPAYAGLSHRGLAAQLRPWLRNRDAFHVARRMAIDIAERCALQEVCSDLADVALDSTDDYRIRVQALHALSVVPDAEARARLHPLLSVAEDENDELLGYALTLLHPELSPAALVSYLRQPNGSGSGGQYYNLLNDQLVPHFTDQDLRYLLRWLADQLAEPASDFFRNYFHKFYDQLVRRAWSAMDLPEVMTLLVQIAQIQFQRNEWLFRRPIPPGPDPDLEDSDKRKKFTAAYVRETAADTLSSTSLFQQKFITLDDLDWAILSFEGEMHSEVRQHWMWMVVYFTWQQSLDPLKANTIMEAAERHEDLKHALRGWMGSVRLDSPDAKRMRENHAWAQERELRWVLAQAQEGLDRPPAERLERALRRANGGEPQALSTVFRELRNGPNGTPWMLEQPDPSLLPGWTHARPEIRSQILGATKAFLSTFDVHSAATAGLGAPSAGLIAYKAFRMLLVHDPSWLGVPRADMWSRWLPWIIDCPIRDGSAEHHRLLTWARQAAPAAFLAEVGRLTRQKGAEASDWIVFAYSLRPVWDSQLGAVLLSECRSAPLAPSYLASLLSLLLSQAVEGAGTFALSLLTTPDSAPERASAGVQALLLGGTDENWPALRSFLESQSALCKAGLAQLPNEVLDRFAARYSEQSLEELYRWLCGLHADVSEVASPTHLDHHRLDELKTEVRKQLRERRTPAACEVLHRLGKAYPEDHRLRVSYAMARTMMAERSWRPMATEQILSLCSRTGREGLRFSLRGTPVHQLFQLLTTLFPTGDDFRIWVRRGQDGQKLTSNFPGSIASQAQTLTEGIEILRQHGHINGAFFARLETDFSQYRAYIAEVCIAWSSHSSAK